MFSLRIAARLTRTTHSSPVPRRMFGGHGIYEKGNADSPVSEPLWGQNERYHNSFLMHPDPDIDATVNHNELNHLRNIAVPHSQGKFLNLLIKSVGAKRVLEIGTLGGFSALWMAKALPDDGKLVTLELDPQVAKVAQENIDRAHLSSKVDIIVGSALETLPSLSPPFDVAFIDANKEASLEYYMEAKRLVRSGGVIIVDNAVQDFTVAMPEKSSPRIEGIRRLLNHLKTDKDADGTTLTTIAAERLDGFIFLHRN